MKIFYRHIKTNKPYIKVLSTKVKTQGVWIEAIVYMCLYLNKDGMFWVRLVDDFKNNFE